MKVNRPLDQLLANEARIQILRTLFKFPGEFTGRHIARLSRLPHATARLNLIALEDGDILKVKYIGRSKVYSLNTDNILRKPLADLFEAEQSVMQALESKLINALLSDNKIKNALAHASIYGSVIRGDERPDSDIDLLLIFDRKVDKSKLEKVLDQLDDEISTSFGKQLHIMLIECKTGSNEWRNALRPAFLNELAEHSKILYGKDATEVLIARQKKQKQSQRNPAKKKA